jgi:TolB-like protein
MLSGRRAFTGDSTIAIMAAIVRDQPASLEAPLAVQSIVTRCLRKSAAERFQSMGQVKGALLAAGTGVLPALHEQQQPSIAVLPFANMGGDKENEYFSDGLAEEIINFLAQLPGLKVTARTSAFAFKGKTEDIRKIADTLGVASILEGSVRRSGSRIRVTAQLINAKDGYHLWSQRYDREMADLFDLQDEIAQAIASALQVKLSGPPAPLVQYKPSLPAYEALLKARYYSGTYRPDLLPRAKEFYEQAIALDPKFALAHCAYGIYFVAMAISGVLPANQALPMARSQAQKALEMDPSLSEGQAMLGIVAANLEYDWKEAEGRFPPGDGFAIPCQSLCATGTPWPTLCAPAGPSKPFSRVELALQGDPLNLQLRFTRAHCLAAIGRDEDAAEGYREILELNPAMTPAQVGLANQHVFRGELDQALALCEKAYAVAPLPNVIGLLAGLLKRTGDTRRAEELLERLQPGDAFGAPRGLAVYYWVLREFDAAADWFREGHRPARSCWCRISAGLVRKGTALHSALGRVDAEAESAGSVSTVPPVPHLAYSGARRDPQTNNSNCPAVAEISDNRIILNGLPR